MRSTLEIEGTWEEILANANEFSGKRVRLTLLEKDLSQESDLFQEINLGFSTDTWAEYHTLIAKRQAEILTENEQQQLIEISDRLEAANVRRIQALIELSNLRGQSLDSLMLELGIPTSR
jgi:hypothetical protein